MISLGSSEPSLVQAGWSYIRTTIAYWWVIVPGIIMPLRDVLNIFKKLGKTPRWLELAVIFVCLLLAQFLAYRNCAINLYRVIDEKREKSIEVNSLQDGIRRENIEIDRLKDSIENLQEGKEEIKTYITSVNSPYQEAPEGRAFLVTTNYAIQAPFEIGIKCEVPILHASQTIMRVEEGNFFTETAGKINPEGAFVFTVNSPNFKPDMAIVLDVFTRGKPGRCVISVR